MNNKPATPKRGANDREAIAPSTFTPRAGIQNRERNNNPLLYLLAGLAPFVAVVLWFVFTAKAVQIHVEASSEPHIKWHGGLAIRVGDRYLVRQGMYQLSISATGYHSLEQAITVTTRALQQHRYQLKPLPGRLHIESMPPGATVTTNEKTLGTTPLKIDAVDPGEQLFTLNLARYQRVNSKIMIKGRDQQQHLKIELKPDWADIKLSSEPSAATVFVGGIEQGQTPLSIEVLSGEQQITLKKPGFADHHQTLRVVAGEAQTLDTITLKPAAASVTLNSTPSGANITLNSVFVGSTPAVLALAPEQQHTLRLSLPGYHVAQQTLRLSASEKRELDIPLTPELGDINLRITPADATVRVNKKPFGTGSQTLSLPTTTQRLHISKPGYSSHSQDVTPRAGITQSITIDLKKNEQTTPKAGAAIIKTSQGQTLKRLDGGRFTMGAARREPGRRANETVHTVSLKRPFYLQTKEVSNAQFKKFRPAHSSGAVNGKSLDGANQPVVNVSWTDAALYCNWLSRREGLTPFYTQNGNKITGFNPKSTAYRLPSEAEWAFAARVNENTMRRYAWNTNSLPPPKNFGNFADQNAKGLVSQLIPNYQDGAAVTAPVGHFAPNPLGLYDLGGNAAEWMHDVYRISFDGEDEKTDPLGPQTGAKHSIRGASWADALPSRLRLSYRLYDSDARNDTGFRLARYVQ